MSSFHRYPVHALGRSSIAPPAAALTLALLALGVTVASAQVRTQSRGGSCPPEAVLMKGGNCVISLTTTIGDTDANGFPADISSDGFGSYSNNAGGVTSFLTSNVYNGLTYGDWQFGTYDSTTRNVNHSLDADDEVLPGDSHYTAPANPPFAGTQGLQTHLEVKCTMVYNNMLAMTAGSSFTCPFLNRFNYGGVDYRLDAAYSWSHYAETTDAQVVCNGADSGGCNDWSIDPIGQGEAVGRLVMLSQKGNQPPVNDGDFYMRFHIHITRP